MARASPTASSRRASGLRNAPRSPVWPRVKRGQTTRVRVPEARPFSRLSIASRDESNSVCSVGVGASSTASNIVIGLAGMMVEIACL